MQGISASDLRVYVVWSSQLAGNGWFARRAASQMADPRVMHFWDGERLVGRVFSTVVGTQDAAWDVWMLFGRGIRWDGERPPDPSWWEHQLPRLPAERHLDPERFARKARELLRDEASAQK